MKKYLKAFILFPLLIQIIGTVALAFSNNDTDQIQRLGAFRLYCGCSTDFSQLRFGRHFTVMQATT